MKPRICQSCGDAETDLPGAELVIRTGASWSVHTQEVWLCPDCWHWFDARLNRPRHTHQGEPCGAADTRPVRLAGAAAGSA